MSLEKYILPKEATALEALEKINLNGKGIAYVCDNLLLMAAITDGDIRRFILKNGNLSKNVLEIANCTPKSILQEQDIDSKNFMKEHKITSVPILSNEGYILSIDFLHSNKVYKDQLLGLPVVIMAGGKGKRLHPYTQILPKPLIPIGDKTITERIMDYFKNFSCNQFEMIVNYKKEFIKSYFFDKGTEYNIHFTDENEFMGTGGGLKLIKDKVQGDFILSNCDILIDTDLSEIYKFHKENKNLVTIVGVMKEVTIPYGVLTYENKKLSIKEKPVYNFITNSGVYIFDKKILDYIPENTFIHITDVIQNCANANEKIEVFPITEHAWMDMGQLDELENMRNKYESE